MKSYLKILAILNLFLVLVITSNSCGNSELPSDVKVDSTSIKSQALLEKAEQFFQPLPEIASDESHIVTDEKASLGKMLYYDTRLSKTGNSSCNSCHNLNTYGVDNEKTSLSDAGKRGIRNSPTVLNAAIHFAQFWDGRAKDVEEQADMNPLEIEISHGSFMIDRLEELDEYKEAFAIAFPESNSPISYDNLKNAIGAFERTLMTPSRFDHFLKGDITALGEEEQKGLKVFMNVGCTNCHIGPALGGNMFQKFGLFKDYRPLTNSGEDDTGRMRVTESNIDKDMFKVAGLRNIEKTHPYFHDGSVDSLATAIKIMGEVQLNKNLTEEEVNSIEIFLKALTGNVPEDAKMNPFEIKMEANS